MKRLNKTFNVICKKIALAATTITVLTAAAPALALDNATAPLAPADAKMGRIQSQACGGCHSLDKGQPDKMGPNLWNVVNAPRAGKSNFNYSAAMKALKDKKWSHEELNRFLENPMKEIPGTKMAFLGVKDAQTRANIIAYLGTLSDKPAAVSAPAPQQPVKVKVKTKALASKK